ncbi:hypothetical protein IT568_04640 [bacterium]|nr:hypothetical protein [bacterium]
MFKQFILALALFVGTLNAQTKTKLEDVKNQFEDLEDSMVELNDGMLTLRFFNALNGQEIDNAKVEILNEIYTTDFEGKISFPVPEEDGTYGFSFKKDGFITSNFKIEIDGGTIFSNNRFSISPLLDLEHLRIVLDWDKNPDDLDAHFVKENGYHISYRRKKTSADGTAKLDRDDRDGYGPETITIKEIDKNASYSYYVHDYSNKENSNSQKLSDSKANVKVYGNGMLLNVFEVPKLQKGLVWEVFKIENGKISGVNQVFENEN